MTRFATVCGFAFAVCVVITGCAASNVFSATMTTAGIDPEAPGYVTASGIVTGVVEDGGSCVFTFWADNGEATRLTADGRRDGDHTACGPVSEPLGFMRGTQYEVQLKYESLNGQQVTSERALMELPHPTT